jgi:methionine-rich copper-binding protein CopC
MDRTGPAGQEAAIPDRESLMRIRFPLVRTGRAAILAGLFATLSAAPAFAHAVLTSSRPAQGASVPAGDIAIALHYNSRIDQGRSRLALARQGDKETVLPISKDEAPDTLASSAHLAPGAYVLHWQALSVDGHVTRGEIAFTVTGQNTSGTGQ